MHFLETDRNPKTKAQNMFLFYFQPFFQLFHILVPKKQTFNFPLHQMSLWVSKYLDFMLTYVMKEKVKDNSRNWLFS
jgi:hypothetical protein